MDIKVLSLAACRSFEWPCLIDFFSSTFGGKDDFFLSFVLFFSFLFLELFFISHFYFRSNDEIIKGGPSMGGGFLDLDSMNQWIFC